jgi:hypothetical protein
MTTSELAAALGRLGGRSTSPAKVAAVRINLELARKSRWTKPRMVTEEAVRRAVSGHNAPARRGGTPSPQVACSASHSCATCAWHEQYMSSRCWDCLNGDGTLPSWEEHPDQAALKRVHNK